MFKLITKNVRKNLRDYLIYFITLLLTVSLFYSFNSIESQKALNTLNSTRGMLAKQLGVSITILSYIIAIVLAFLIIYANQFLLKRRKKELGIYMMLGMDKWKISSIFVGETFLIGLIALGLGLVLGFMLSQGLSLISLKLFAADLTKFKIVVSVTAFRKTIICFTIIFFTVMVLNAAVISNVKLIDMLTADRKNENFKIKNKLFYNIMFVVSIIMITSAIYLINRYGVLPKSKSFQAAVVLLGVGTALCFYSLSAVILEAVKSNHLIYLKGLNTFLLRQMSSKIQSNYLSMTIVCGLLAATICIISTGMSIALTMNGHAKASVPYDMNVYAITQKTGDVNIYQNLKDKGVHVDQYIKEYIQISNYSGCLKYKELFHGKKVSLWKIDENLPNESVSIISLSDYNKSMNLQKKKGIELKENQFALNCNYKGTKKIMKTFMESSGKINLNGVILNANQRDILNETIIMSNVDNNDRGTIIVPDQYIYHLSKDYSILSAVYKSSIDPDKVVKSLIPLFSDLHSGFSYITKSMIYDAYYGTQAIFSFICCYIGMVFLLISVALLALQQLTETADNIHRYGLLKKLGADPEMINNTLFRQIFAYFAAPLVFAVVYAAFFNQKVMDLILKNLNLNVNVNMMFTIILFLIVYCGYFAATYLSCKKMIHSSDRDY